MDAAEFAAAFAADGRLRWQNVDPVHGPDAIEAFVAGFFEDISGLAHTFTGLYDVPLEDAADRAVSSLVLEAEVTYTRHDDSTVTIPATTVLDVTAADAITDARVYVDTAPLYQDS